MPEVTVNVVLVCEVNPPADDVAVEWLLVTTWPIETIEQVRGTMACYCVRWMIEIVFRVLQSGSRVEERRFERVERLERYLTVPGGVCDRGLANAVRLPAGAELSGHRR